MFGNNARRKSHHCSNASFPGTTLVVSSKSVREERPRWQGFGNLYFISCQGTIVELKIALYQMKRINLAHLYLIAKEQWSKGAYVSSGKLFLQVDLLCEHLIDSTTIFDATIVLNCGEIADSWMGQLYEWMVFRNCSARTFGAFALALQTPGIRLPVLVEQNFANRATNLLRNEDLAQDSDDEL